MTQPNNPANIVAERLWAKYGRGALTFAEGATELLYPTAKAAYTAESRGRFPVRVTDIGGRKSILIADLAKFLATGLVQTRESTPGLRPSRGPGRPRKQGRTVAAASV